MTIVSKKPLAVAFSTSMLVLCGCLYSLAQERQWELLASKEMGQGIDHGYLVFDGKQVILEGDREDGSEETWAWDGTTWSKLNTVGNPTEYDKYQVVYDSKRHKVFFYDEAINHFMYEFDRSTLTWSPVSKEGLSTRECSSMVYDSARDKIVLFGGTGLSLNNDTWEWSGEDRRWMQIVTKNSPIGRYGHAMVYDSNRERVVLYGGTTNTDVLGDTWEFDGNDWLRIQIDGPGTRRFPKMVYDSARKKTVLFSGLPSSEYVFAGDTWEYDGEKWEPINVETIQDDSGSMAYDPIRNVIVLFTGFYGWNEEIGETWELKFTTGVINYSLYD